MNASMHSPILTIRGMSKVYREHLATFEARLPSLTLASGDILGITGPSGCGKSSLLELLALLSVPTSVQSFLFTAGGREYDIAALWRSAPGKFFHLRRQHMGFVHQAGGLMPFLTVHDNILLALQLAEHSKNAGQRARVDELIDFLDLGRVADKLPENLSYGERQRTAIARALIHRPALVLADEPTSALDPQTSYAVMELLLRAVRETKSAALIVTHDHELLDSAGIRRISMLPCSSDIQNPCYELQQYESTSLVSSNCTHKKQEKEAIECAPKETVTESKTSSFLGRLFASLQTVFLLAWKDFLHDRSLSLCAVLALTASLTPVLLLAGIKTGVTGIFEERLLSNPASLSIVPLSSQRYTPADLERMRTLEGVSFIVPQTRILASSVLLSDPGTDNSVQAEAVPTAPGDPLLLRYASDISGEAVVLTQQTVRSLPDIRPGDIVSLSIGRRHQGKLEQVFLQLPVHAILPDAADGASHVYLPFAIVQDIERYRDGLAVPVRNWPGKSSSGEEAGFAGFRMYAKDLESVVILRDLLQEKGIRVHTWAREIETLQHLKFGLTMTTALIGLVAMSGMVFSLASLAVSNVRRKARLFAQCALMGMNRREQVSLPLFQQIFIACGAIVVSALAYAIASALFDTVIGPWLGTEASVCTLEAAQYAFLQAVVLVLSCGCGLAACFRILALQPAEVLRHDA